MLLKMSELLRPEQAARILNVNVETIRRWIRLGKLKAIKLPGGYLRISRLDLQGICGLNLESFKVEDRVNITENTAYLVWTNMIDRCRNQNNPKWNYYGGRGIIVCERWQDSFENFINDMGERPNGLTLDRINPDGNYEPSNCRWATKKEQRNNRSSNYL